MDSRRGMTLLEVLIALSILAIAFVLLIRAHVQSFTMVAEGDTLARAALLEESVCARLTAFGWADGSARYGYEEGPPRLFYKVTIESVPVPHFRKVVISVSRDKGAKPLMTLTRWVLIP